MKSLYAEIGVGCLVMLLASSGFANGYKVLCVKSAKATGMGEAFTAQADDPSAVTINPAGLAQLSGNRVSVQGTLCNAFTEHTSSGGVKTDMEDGWQTVPSFFLTSDLGRDDLGVGLGVCMPNGMSTEWAEDSFARYVATLSDLTVVDISPAAGVKLNETLFLGCGADLYYSEARLEKMVDAGVAAGGGPVGLDLPSRMDGDGTAWGGQYRASLGSQ